MDTGQATEHSMRITVSNVGGIAETSVELTPGVTVLAGRNATNRTSFLQALMAAMGSERVSLKGDADDGSVELTLGEETYTRTLTRQGEQVVFGGDPYLGDPELADLFAFLLESNEARRAVERGDDLRELVMRPVDTEAIQREIRRVTAERRSLDDTLEELESLENRLPTLEGTRSRLETELETKRERLASVEAEIDDLDVDVSAQREEKAELESKLDDLGEKRSALEELRFDLETQRESIDRLDAEREEYEAKLDALPAVASQSTAEIEAELSTLREKKQRIDSAVSDLQNVVSFNEELLEDVGSNVASALHDHGGEHPTEQLLNGEETVACWTCGSEVARSRIEQTLETLRSLRQEKFDARNRVREDIEALQSSLRDLESTRERKRTIERRLEAIANERESRTDRIETLQAKQEELVTDVERIETEIEALRGTDYDEVLDRHREANELEVELRATRSDLDDVTEEIEQVERRLDERERLTDEREQATSRLEELRTQVDSIEAQAVEAFNTHMDAVLDVLEYDNIERIWTERVDRGDGERTFELHVIRSSASGATYEDTVDHLSESEREVTGLVFALAGYLVHEVHETVPFMLLDSLEAIDSARIAALTDYLESYADFTVLALLDEDAAALDETYERVSQI